MPTLAVNRRLQRGQLIETGGIVYGFRSQTGDIGVTPFSRIRTQQSCRKCLLYSLTKRILIVSIASGFGELSHERRAQRSYTRFLFPLQFLLCPTHNSRPSFF